MEATARRASAPPATLVELLEPAAVDFTTLHARYGSLLELVRKLIGVVPNCDPYLEIWPPAFRSYNVMVPNFLNLPFFLWGWGAPKAPVALAMYAASRAAECMYCSAHTCAFALRRGVEERRIAALASSAHGDDERAAIAVAQAISRVPADLTGAQRDELRRRFSPADAEWVVLGAAMMGFLNKMMDALGVELEDATVAEVEALIAPSGWTAGKHRVLPTDSPAPPSRGDALALKIGLVRHLPTALVLDRRWTAGVPSRWPAVGDFLRSETGHDFPVLKKLRHGRAVRAIAAMLRDNCAARESRLGLGVKHGAGLVFARVIEDASLAEQTRVLARAAGAKDLDAIERFAAEPTDFDDPAAVERALREHGPALLLAKAASFSPARIGPLVVEQARALEPAAIVELVTWLSVLQMLHRLGCYYGA